MLDEQIRTSSLTAEIHNEHDTQQGRAQEPKLMKLRGRKSAWMIWVVSYAVWIFIAFMTGFSMYRFMRIFDQSTAGLWSQLKLPLINDLIYATLTPLVLRMALRFPIQPLNWRVRSLFYAGGAVLFTASHALVRMMVYPVMDPRIGHPFPVDGSLFVRLFLYNLPDDCFGVYLPVVTIAHVLWYYHEFRDRDLRTSQLETRLAQAQLKALKSQLQPHFLFNTLHSISTLMLTNARAADTMLARLSDLLRMSLENNTVQETTLHREMQFVTGYLEIEKMRFGDRLEVHCDVHPDTLDARVPHLLLQPLVENAIRHGASRRSVGGQVWINAFLCDGELHIEVGDNGPGFSPKPEWNARHGLGLNATRERLRVFYADRQRLDIHSAPERGTTVSLVIPFNTDKAPVVYELDAIHGLG